MTDAQETQKIEIQESKASEADDLAQFEEMNLVPVRLLAPPGVNLYDTNVLFSALAACQGLIIITDDRSDPRWYTLRGAGMPQDMRQIDVIFTAAAYNKKYIDFAIHCKGVMVDPDNPKKGKSAWQLILTHNDTGKTLNVHVWFAELFLRNSSARLLAYYNSGEEELFNRLTGLDKGCVRIELFNADPNNKKASHRLIDNDVLLLNAQKVLDSALESRRGPKVKAEIDLDTLPSWAAQYQSSLDRLTEMISNHTPRKKWGKYSKQDRVYFLQKSLEVEGLTAGSLAEYGRLSDVCLQFTAWKCSHIDIGTYERTHLWNKLKESEQLVK